MMQSHVCTAICCRGTECSRERARRRPSAVAVSPPPPRSTCKVRHQVAARCGGSTATAPQSPTTHTIASHVLSDGVYLGNTNRLEIDTSGMTNLRYTPFDTTWLATVCILGGLLFPPNMFPTSESIPSTSVYLRIIAHTNVVQDP